MERILTVDIVMVAQIHIKSEIETQSLQKCVNNDSSVPFDL